MADGGPVEALRDRLRDELPPRRRHLADVPPAMNPARRARLEAGIDALVARHFGRAPDGHAFVLDSFEKVASHEQDEHWEYLTNRCSRTAKKMRTGPIRDAADEADQARRHPEQTQAWLDGLDEPGVKLDEATARSLAAEFPLIHESKVKEHAAVDAPATTARLEKLRQEQGPLTQEKAELERYRKKLTRDIKDWKATLRHSEGRCRGCSTATRHCAESGGGGKSRSRPTYRLPSSSPSLVDRQRHQQPANARSTNSSCGQLFWPSRGRVRAAWCRMRRSGQNGSKWRSRAARTIPVQLGYSCGAVQRWCSERPVPKAPAQPPLMPRRLRAGSRPARSVLRLVRLLPRRCRRVSG